MAEDPAPALTPPPAPPYGTPPLAAKAEKKKAPKKKAPKKAPAKPAVAKPAPPKLDAVAAELKTVPLVPGPAVVVANNVNVRGQAKLNSEVVTRLTKDQQVTVLEEIVHKTTGPDEPSAWAKILLSPETKVWLNSIYVSNNAVAPKKLNLRSGPGENYSVVGLMRHGDTVKEVSTKGDWVQIEAPADAYAFVAAQFLKQDSSAIATAITPPPAPPTPPTPPALPTPPAPPPPPPPTPATVADSTPIAPAPTDVPKPPAPVAALTPPPAPSTPVMIPALPVLDGPPTRRIVQREGVVRGTVSIQAPSKYALISPETGETIDYLHTTSSKLDLSRYKGMRIIVTGEEGLDERWGNTPVILIQKINVLDEGPKAPKKPSP